MVSQTTMNNGRARQESVSHDFATVLHDITELSELQVRLAVLDAKSAIRKLIVPLILGVVAVVLLLASLPILLMSIAHAMALTGMALVWCYLLSFGIGVVVCAVLGFTAYTLAKRGLSVFRRSSEQLKRNVQWLKATLKHG